MAEIPRTSSRQRWTLALVCTAAFMPLLDITVVSVALPSIQRDLRASLPEVGPEYERKVPRSLLLRAALFVELAAALDDHASATVDGHGVTFTASAVLLVEVLLRRR